MSITEQVTSIVSEYLGVDSVPSYKTLDELGIDSLTFLEISIELEETFGSKGSFSLREIGQLHTVQDIITAIEQR